MVTHIIAIRKFLKDHPKIEEQHLTTSEINSMFIKPETKGIGYPFITQYINQCDALTGKPLVQPATVFISHAWRYSFYDVVVEVMEQHACEHPDAYFWFDLFTNDQNALASNDFDWFQTTFTQGVREIGQVLLVVSSWNDHIPIQRAWCLYEIFTVLEDPKIA